VVLVYDLVLRKLNRGFQALILPTAPESSSAETLTTTTAKALTAATFEILEALAFLATPPAILGLAIQILHL
jgi:hypothetical protein